MVIAHILSSFGMGGQERMVVDLSRGLRSSGHRVVVISLAPPPEGPHAEHLRQAGAKVVTLPKKPRGFDAGLSLRLASVFSREKVQLVHTHNPQPLIYGAPAGKLLGVGVVHTKHGANPDFARRKHLRRLAATCTDAYVAVSDATANVARKNSECAPKKLTVIPNGVDVRRFRKDPEARRRVRQQLGLPLDAWVLGTVGRLAPEKQHSLLIEAAAPLLDQHVRLVIIGDGPEREKLAALRAQNPKREYISLPGALSDAAAAYSAFDVFVLSSSTEGLPLVIPEAMSASLPIVSTAVGGIPDVLEQGYSGFLVPANTAPVLTACLRSLERNRDLARDVGARAARIAHDSYSTERMLRSYLELYGRVLPPT